MVPRKVEQGLLQEPNDASMPLLAVVGDALYGGVSVFLLFWRNRLVDRGSDILGVLMVLINVYLFGRGICKCWCKECTRIGLIAPISNEGILNDIDEPRREHHVFKRVEIIRHAWFIEQCIYRHANTRSGTCPISLLRHQLFDLKNSNI
ncbi:hypothetical protein J3E68DRAFT_412917 [Trichoderma sp. SZMC 28012]